MPLDHQVPRLASPWGPSVSMGSFRSTRPALNATELLINVNPTRSWRGQES
jgi:hypothetical protein